jgi:hypothetical protein
LKGTNKIWEFGKKLVGVVLALTSLTVRGKKKKKKKKKPTKGSDL